MRKTDRGFVQADTIVPSCLRKKPHCLVPKTNGKTKSKTKRTVPIVFYGKKLFYTLSLDISAFIILSSPPLIHKIFQPNQLLGHRGTDHFHALFTHDAAGSFYETIISKNLDKRALLWHNTIIHNNSKPVFDYYSGKDIVAKQCNHAQQ